MRNESSSNHEPRLSRRGALGFFAGGLAALCGSAEAADWPVWRGLRRTGVSDEKGWTTNWGGGPKRLWGANVGTGYSTVAAQGGRIYTLGASGGQDTVVCLDAATGRVVWRQSFRHGSRTYGADPNPTGSTTTPVIDRDRVYVLHREGLGACLDAASGRVIWQRDMRRETSGELPNWGFAGSPLVYGDSVIYNVGTSGIAVNKATGQVTWKSGNGKAGYAAPVAYTIGGVRGVAIFSGTALHGVNPGTGRVLWSHPWQTSYDVNAADPLIYGDKIFITSGYNRGCALLKIGARPQVLFENKNMRCQFNSPVLIGDHVYGNDANTLKCLDLRNGNEAWQHRGIGNGGLMAADNKLIVLTDRGELFVAAATPARFQELARARVMSGVSWPHPVLADGKVYCRNNAGDLACFSVR